MLELRPDCERCGRNLAPDARDAMICSFECTFCRECADDELKGTCPNCGGRFEPRPVRPPELLDRYPASTERYHR